MKAYICDECKKDCSQVYGCKVDGKYTEKCVKCMFKPNENKKGKKELSRNSK